MAELIIAIYQERRGSFKDWFRPRDYQCNLSLIIFCSDVTLKLQSCVTFIQIQIRSIDGLAMTIASQVLIVLLNNARILVKSQTPKNSLKMIITEYFQYSSLRKIDNKKLQEVENHFSFITSSI